MSDKGYGEEAKDWFKNVYDGVVKWLDDHDSQSWPAFGVFFAVVTVGMFFNVQAFTPVVGQIASISIGVFFEYAIIAWKSTTSRKRNNKKQNNIAYGALWLSVILAISMLIVNLFRIGGQQAFEYTAYVIVGIAAAVQVVAYLLFDQANPDKIMTREHSQNEREVVRKDRNADYIIAEVRADAKIIRRIGDELQAIRRENRDLPTSLLEPLLEAARKRLLKDYANNDQNIDEATKGLSDVDGDGKVGERPIGKPQGIGPKDARERIVNKYADLPQNLTYQETDLEKLKELPIETLFEDEALVKPLASGTPTDNRVANETPTDTEEPDF